MDKTNHNPQYKRQVQYKLFKVQTKVFFEYLKTNLATASMVAKATGIPQKNITRFKREFEKAGLLVEVMRSQCKDTGFNAWYLSTNPTLIKSISKTQNPYKS
jgi:hypothetical protein